MLKSMTTVFCIAVLSLVILNIPFVLNPPERKKDRKCDASRKTIDLIISGISILIVLICTILSFVKLHQMNSVLAMIAWKCIGIAIYAILASFACLILFDVMCARSKNAPIELTEIRTIMLAGLLIQALAMYRLGSDCYNIDKPGVLDCIAIILEFTAYLFALSTEVILLAYHHSQELHYFFAQFTENSEKCTEMIGSMAWKALRKNVASIRAWEKMQIVDGWKRIGCAFVLCFYFILDVLISTFSLGKKCVLVLLYLVIDAINNIGKFVCRIVGRVKRISTRSMVTLSFRISVLLATLMVVVLAEYGIIPIACDDLSILQYFSSVIIIPLVFSWIQNAFNNK